MPKTKMAESKIETSEYFKDGETYTIGHAYLFGMVGGTGTAFGFNVWLPKKIPEGMTVTASGTMNNIRADKGNAITSGMTVNSNVSITTRDCVYIVVSRTGLTASAFLNCVPESITLTFTRN